MVTRYTCDDLLKIYYDGDYDDDDGDDEGDDEGGNDSGDDDDDDDDMMSKDEQKGYLIENIFFPSSQPLQVLSNFRTSLKLD